MEMLHWFFQLADIATSRSLTSSGFVSGQQNAANAVGHSDAC